ncbi:MAG: DNA-3-methyladenine glycosylase I, partial [Gemmatimonadetes bacterium]|nr:DNA-3-methyladenine glycosylase I [Gemmatimonadota bacterium]NIU74725.1 DNA-3-methyladenine glycosylase I [Gammaproteobacteria bacterium]NIW35735.1 DNA-3-methyladenine glycosylase I [Gemmatimonadota bacterium]NIX44650.1 DNA-3-methyladenine glycosylase I [Gemmatimonadota bacterium]NIY08878.1 DNA-3-methyladenine glycosylase I [Gemmatimonadota bacterium]
LFAKLLLDGAQAGLSWITILRKRENYYRAFDDFDPEAMARYDDARIEALLQDPGIVRNRQKVNAFVKNARAYLALQEEDSFSDFLWSFVDGAPVQNAWERLDQLPAETERSTAMSRALKSRGFTFVGPTICYAFMQAVGMVNDHVVSCHRYQPVRALGTD